MPDPEPRLNFLRAYGALIPTLLVGSIVGIALQDADRVIYIAAGVFALLLAALHFLPARAAGPLADCFEGLGEFAFGSFLFLLFQVPGIGAYVFSRYVIETFPRGLQLAIMLLWLLALGAASVLMYSRPLWRKFRQRVEDWLYVRFRVDSPSGRLPVWVAVALYIDFVLIAMGGFAAFAFILHASGPPLFTPRRPRRGQPRHARRPLPLAPPRRDPGPQGQRDDSLGGAPDLRARGGGVAGASLQGGGDRAGGVGDRAVLEGRGREDRRAAGGSRGCATPRICRPFGVDADRPGALVRLRREYARRETTGSRPS